MYVLARQEGTAYNSKVISFTKVKEFKALPNKYYIIDAGYSNTPITLTLYHGVRYHFCKQAQVNITRQNAKELYNLQYVALRNVVEYTIGIFKNWFRFFKAGRHNIPLRTQIEVVYALTAVYNFINIYNLDDLNSFLTVEDKKINKENRRLIDKGSNIGINKKRDIIARLIQESYCQVISRPIIQRSILDLLYL